MTPKQRSIYRNGSVQFAHGNGSVKCSVKEKENWYMNYTFTIKMHRKSTTTNKGDYEHSLYL